MSIFVNLLTFCGSQLDVVESVEAAGACHGVVVSFVGEAQAKVDVVRAKVI